MQQELTRLSTYSTSASNRVPYSLKQLPIGFCVNNPCLQRQKQIHEVSRSPSQRVSSCRSWKSFFQCFQPHHEKRYINSEPDRQFLYHLHSKVQICKVFENDQWISCISVSINYFGFFNDNHSPTDRGRERSSC